jgi:alpha-L-fucosidase 2
MSVDLAEKRARWKLLAAFFAVLVLLTGFTLAFVAFFSPKQVPSPVRVACVGDSSTEASGYPIGLQNLLGNGYRVANFGVGGSTVLLSSDKPYMNQTVFQKAKHFQPNIVVIMLGTNDANPAYYNDIDNFVGNYETLIGEFEALESKPQIWLVLPPPIYSNASGPNSANLEQGIIPRILQVANQQNLPTIDVYAALTNHPKDFLADGLHPNREGAKVIATQIYQTITQTQSNS